MTSSPCFVLQSPGRGAFLWLLPGAARLDRTLLLGPRFGNPSAGMELGTPESKHRAVTSVSNPGKTGANVLAWKGAHTHTHTHFQGRNQSCGRLAEGDDAPPEPSRPEAVKTVGSGFALLHRLWCCLNRGRAEAPAGGAGGAGGTCGPRSSDRQDINRKKRI